MKELIFDATLRQQANQAYMLTVPKKFAKEHIPETPVILRLEILNISRPTLQAIEPKPQKETGTDGLPETKC